MGKKIFKLDQMDMFPEIHGSNREATVSKIETVGEEPTELTAEMQIQKNQSYERRFRHMFGAVGKHQSQLDALWDIVTTLYTRKINV